MVGSVYAIVRFTFLTGPFSSHCFVQHDNLILRLSFVAGACHRVFRCYPLLC